MKTLFSALIALGFLVGAAQAAPVTPAQTDTIVEWGCGGGYGH